MAKNFKIVMAIISILLGFSVSAHATLIGDTVWMEQRFPTFNQVFGGPYFHVVTTDASDAFPGGAVSYDMNAMSLTITAVMNYGPLGGTFNGAVFGDLDFLPAVQLAGLSLLSSGIPGFDISRTGILSDNSFWLDFAGLTVQTGQSITIGFETAAVPLPASLLIFGSGLLGVVGLRRRGGR